MATTLRTESATTSQDRPALVGLAVTIALMLAAMVVPLVFGWNVNARSFPPLDSIWDPRVGPGTLPAVVMAVLVVATADRVAAAVSWLRLLAAAYVSGVAWLTSLATVDGWGGIGDVLGRGNEYLQDARGVTDVPETLRTFTDHIPLASPDNWATHVAGHPPGALLFFVALVRVGLGSGLAAGVVVLLIAATTPVAVLITLRRLGADSAARAVAPLLVFGPAAIWSAVSADAMFGACGAWGLCCLAVAATTPSRGRAALWALGSGLLLGYCVLLSYGLPLLGILAVAVLVAARRVHPLPWAAVGGAAVVFGFAAGGFAWWEALPVLRTRYYDGIAAVRPASYWVFGDFAALGFSAGPIVGASVATAVARFLPAVRGAAEGARRCIVLLSCSAALAVVVADLSFMSKAETERIWLPFVPWLLVGCALLPDRWRGRGLVAQVALALVLQTLLYTRW
jgi:hypothetical protein